jgi:hypothetical protein
VCIWRARNATQGARAGERREGNRERARTRGSQACSRWCFNVKVEVDERVEFLEREGLRRLVVDEHTLPFLRGLLIALEHNHLIILDRTEFPVSASVCMCAGDEGGGERGGKRMRQGDER